MDNSSIDVVNGTFTDSNKVDTIRTICVICVVGFIASAAVVGNIFVMTAFFTDPKIQQNVSNLFILSMSIADCIVGLITLPINTSFVLLGYWPFGKIVCQIWLSLDYSISLVSIHMITMISLDRFWLVTKKLKYKEFRTRQRVKAMIFTSWMIVLTFYFTTTFLWQPLVAGESYIDYITECNLEALYNSTFSTSMLFVEFIIPLMAIVTFNTIVYYNIRKRAQGFVHSKPSQQSKLEVKFSNIQSQEALSISSLSTINDSTTSTTNLTLSTGEAEKRSEFQRHRKAAITLAIIVGVFLCCLTPYYAVSILFAVCEKCVPANTWEIVNYILWCNSAINPFLYALTIVHFRRNFGRFLGLSKLQDK